MTEKNVEEIIEAASLVDFFVWRDVPEEKSEKLINEFKSKDKLKDYDIFYIKDSIVLKRSPYKHAKM